jgi:hypothetical protein
MTDRELAELERMVNNLPDRLRSLILTRLDDQADEILRLKCHIQILTAEYVKKCNERNRR